MSSLAEAAAAVGQALVERQLQLVLAESCTGGWLSKVCTDVPGSSAWLDFAIVSYSNTAKQRLLNVPAEVLAVNGAVSRQTAIAMAEGAINGKTNRVGIAVTGVAGPSGGTVEKPVGLVWFAWLIGHSAAEAESVIFTGGREAVRRQSVEFALVRALTHINRITIG